MIDHLLYENKNIVKDHNLNPSNSYGNYSLCAWPPQYSNNDYFDLMISLRWRMMWLYWESTVFLSDGEILMLNIDLFFLVLVACLRPYGHIQGVPLRRRLAYNIQYLRNACMYQNQILYMCSWTLYEQLLVQQLFSPTPNFGGIDSLLRVLWRFFKSILRIFEIFSILNLSGHFQVFYRL